ncbi:putative reverse transcriptase domain-containing protein, partial [Tanacetum coccineum]
FASYYRRFIANSSKVAKPLASLTQKIRKYEWVKEQEEAFQTFKDNLCDTPILSLPDGSKEFVFYYDASNQGLGCVLMQRGKVENATAEMLHGLDQLMERKEGGGDIDLKKSSSGLENAKELCWQYA